MTEKKNRKHNDWSRMVYAALGFVGVGILGGILAAYLWLLQENRANFIGGYAETGREYTIGSVQETAAESMPEAVQETVAEPMIEAVHETEEEHGTEAVSEAETEYISEAESECMIEIISETEREAESFSVDCILSTLTLEEKVAQLFIVTPELLTGISPVTAAGEATKETLQEYPVGGLVYLSQNIISREQVTTMLNNTQKYSMERVHLPMFTCVDEEGGTVTRISGRGVIDVPYIDTMQNIGYGECEDAFDTGMTIGSYLRTLGFNVDFAPVADVITNPTNTVIGSRAFSSDPAKAAEMAAAFVNGIHSENVAATLKHFPGHGDTAEDSHTSSAVSYKTLNELWGCEFIPFSEGIAAGADLIMIGHISLPNVTGDYIPATLSKVIVTDILREKLNFKGIIITDAMNMAAISDYYSSAEAAVKAIQAGVDMILMPVDFQSAYYGILDAVKSGVISENRIDQSIKRIISLKLKLAE